MKFVRKRESTKDRSGNENRGQLKNDCDGLLRNIAKRLMWSLGALFAYLEYYVGIRPYFNNHHGIWSVGFLDGAVVTSTLLIIGFYIWSIPNAEQSVSRARSSLGRREGMNQNSITQDLAYTRAHIQNLKENARPNLLAQNSVCRTKRLFSNIQVSRYKSYNIEPVFWQKERTRTVRYRTPSR